MIQKVQIQTLDGVREYPFIPDAAAFKAAADAGEISVGDEIIYRQWVVLLLDDLEMLILTQHGVPFMNPNTGGDTMGFGFGAPDIRMTVNGIPVDPAQFMKG